MTETPLLTPLVSAQSLASTATDQRLRDFEPSPAVGVRDGSVAISSHLDAHRRLIEEALDEAVRVGTPRVLYEAMRYSLLAGGKRLRPIVCLAACEAAGAPADQALPAAVAIEMIHTMSLIHDDLPAMDNAPLRRGRPSSHVVYGDAMAVLTGDALMAAAIEYVVTRAADAPPARVVDVVRTIARAIGPAGMAGGQAMDLMSTRQPTAPSWSLDDLESRKTAALIECAAVAGGILGGASPGLLSGLERYGLALGRALQIVDDVLDATGTATKLGKIPGGDAAAGRATYVASHGLVESRRCALALVEEAVAAVRSAGQAGASLRHIARLVVAQVD